MTPREKANQLFYLYYQYCNNSIVRRDYAKECVLIAVDEILSLFINQCEDTKYWREVKKEIKKI